MHIALVYHSRLPVRGYGGTERVVVWLARGLVELGHRVTLLSAPGSAVPGVGCVGVPTRISTRPGFDVRPYLPEGVDVLHVHHRVPPVDGLAYLFTLHGNLRPGGTLPPGTVCLSADHARRHGVTDWVHNGMDPAEAPFRSTKGDADLFLGRLHSVKGWQVAVEGARRAQRKLVVAGGWRPVLNRWVRFAGSVAGDRKWDLLAGARLLWSPVQWDEPFGLTTIEALACGTPVLGTRRGALPEIVTPEVGALGDSLDELLDLIPHVERCAPEACRALVEERFHYRVMAERYLELYRRAG